MKFTVSSGDEKRALSVEEDGDGYLVSDGKTTWRVKLDGGRGAIQTAAVDEGRHKIGVLRRGESWEIVLDGVNYEFQARDARFEKLLDLQRVRGGASLRAEIRAPIPGLVTVLLKKVGDTVKEGEPLLVLAAMKLENEIRSPRDGKVVEVKAKAGAAVEKGDLLVAVE